MHIVHCNTYMMYCTSSVYKCAHAHISTSSDSIHQDLKAVVYSAGIAFGDLEEWDYLWNIYQTTDDTAEKAICLAALANARVPWLLAR